MAAPKETLVFTGEEKSGWTYTEEFGTSRLSLSAEGTFVFTHSDTVVQQYNSTDEDEFLYEVRGRWELGPKETVVLRPTHPYTTIYKKNQQVEAIEPSKDPAPVMALREFVLSMADLTAGSIATPWRSVFRPLTRRHNIAERLELQSGDARAFFVP